MIHDVSCISSLNLSLAGDHNYRRNLRLDLDDHDLNHEHHQQQLEEKSSIVYDPLLPSLTLGLGRDQENDQDPLRSIQQATSNSIVSTVSSFSNSASAKRVERDGGGEEVEKAMSSKAIGDDHIDHDEFEGGSRKKLRLTKEQSFVLEETFKQQSTLNPKQKQTLAKSLNLRARQVEVWFQNRRARTKLKQNEVDCAILKKCCEALTSDNRRLKREIQQLKAVKTTSAGLPPFYMQFPAAAAQSMCPSCERIVSGSGGGGGGSSDTTAVPSKTALISRAPKSQSHLFSQLC